MNLVYVVGGRFGSEAAIGVVCWKGAGFRSRVAEGCFGEYEVISDFADFTGWIVVENMLKFEWSLCSFTRT